RLSNIAFVHLLKFIESFDVQPLTNAGHLLEVDVTDDTEKHEFSMAANNHEHFGNLPTALEHEELHVLVLFAHGEQFFKASGNQGQSFFIEVLRIGSIFL